MEMAMAFRDVLLQLRSYPDPTPTSAVHQAVQFSELLGARISALTFEVRMNVPGNPLAKAVLDIPRMIATERGNSVRNARELICAFEVAATGRALVHRHMVECCMTAEIPDIVTE